MVPFFSEGLAGVAGRAGPPIAVAVSAMGQIPVQVDRSPSVKIGEDGRPRVACVASLILPACLRPPSLCRKPHKAAATPKPVTPPARPAQTV